MIPVSHKYKFLGRFRCCRARDTSLEEQDGVNKVHEPKIIVTPPK